MNFDQLLRMIPSGVVVRYHTDPGPMPQTTAAHSWGVAALIAVLHPAPRSQLLMAALFHDNAETITGDTPHPCKRRWPEMRTLLDRIESEAYRELGLPEIDLTGDEKLWLAWADMLEAVLWGRHLGMEHGMRRYLQVYDNGVEALFGKMKMPEERGEKFNRLFSQLGQQYHKDRIENHV